MSFTLCPVGLNTSCEDGEGFYSVINRLKSQNALPNDSFINNIPFFNIPSLPKEAHIKELFENSFDIELCKNLLKSVAPLSEGAEYKLLPQNYSPTPVMSFAQIVLFKVIACPDGNCPNCPREIATHNQYKDFEYQCPFYHHERDRRRLVIYDSIDKEFVYKANYFDEGKRHGDKEKYSQNYFESMFHPLYYKMFRCKREFCKHSPFCPFFHDEEEKKLWDETFNNFIGKDRVSYIKDRQQKVTDKRTWGQAGSRKGSNEEFNVLDNYGYVDKRAHIRQRQNRKASYQQYTQQVQYEVSKMNFEHNLKAQVSVSKKDSNDSSFDEHINNGFFNKLQSTSGYEIY